VLSLIGAAKTGTGSEVVPGTLPRAANTENGTASTSGNPPHSGRSEGSAKREDWSLASDSQRTSILGLRQRERPGVVDEEQDPKRDSTPARHLGRPGSINPDIEYLLTGRSFPRKTPVCQLSLGNSGDNQQPTTQFPLRSCRAENSRVRHASIAAVGASNPDFKTGGGVPLYWDHTTEQADIFEEAMQTIEMGKQSCAEMVLALTLLLGVAVTAMDFSFQSLGLAQGVTLPGSVLPGLAFTSTVFAVLSVAVTLFGTLALCMFISLAARVPPAKALAFMAAPAVKKLKQYGIYALGLSIPLLLFSLGSTTLVLTSEEGDDGAPKMSLLGFTTFGITCATFLGCVWLAWLNFTVENFLELREGKVANLSLSGVAAVVADRTDRTKRRGLSMFRGSLRRRTFAATGKKLHIGEPYGCRHEAGGDTIQAPSTSFPHSVRFAPEHASIGEERSDNERGTNATSARTAGSKAEPAAADKGVSWSLA